MIYNQDDEENFLSDKKVEEVNVTEPQYRRRGGAYQDEKQTKIANVEQEDEEKSDVFGTVILVIAIIVVAIAVIILLNVFLGNKEEKQSDNDNNSVKNEQVQQNKEDEKDKKADKNTKPTNSSNTSNGSLAISSVNDTYNAYSVQIESVVFKKGGNFYNNNEKIKGDKAYIEYKQISGLKDKEKEEKINKKLKELSTELYDKNYLSDQDTLFIDVHTKLSVNFNTLSYLVIKTYEDIEGNRKDEKVLSYNIRLDNLQEIDFEDLFMDNTNIKSMYSKYTKGKVNAFYYDPKTIYIYEKDLTETQISMAKYYKDIAIYNRYKNDKDIFKSSPMSKTVFTILNSTVSEETKDRDFTKN